MLFYRAAEGKRYRDVLLAKAKTLAVPYLLWNTLLLLHTLVRGYLTNGYWPQFSVWELLSQWLVAPADSVLWFVQVLAGYTVLYPLILWGVRRIWPALAAIVITIVLCCGQWFPIPYASMLFWLPCYLTGALLSYHQGKRMFKAPLFAHKWHYAWVFALFAALWALAPLDARLYYLYWQLSPVLVWALSDPLACLPAPRWWVGASFYLFCSHLLFEHYAVKLYQRFLGTGTLSFALANLLLPCLCAGMALLVAAVLRKTLPKVYALLTGGRVGMRAEVSATASTPTQERL